MHILVTGINGFVGRHLARELASRGSHILGVGREAAAFDNSIVSDYFSCDLTNPDSIKQINAKNVDGIINLAGLANVGASFDSPAEYMRVNSAVHGVLYEHLLSIGLTPRVIAVSTGAVYDTRQPLPQTEESLLESEEKMSPYALSKKRMENTLERFRRAGLECIVVRPFNHIGPGQNPGFLIPDLAQQIIQAQAENRSLRVGNLKTKRDYTDVRDIVRGYADLVTAETLHYDLYNICSGQSHSGEEVLSALLGAFGIAPERLAVEVDQSKIRPNDIPDIYGSHDRLSQDTGWQPSIDFAKTIADFVAWFQASR